MTTYALLIEAGGWAAGQRRRIDQSRTYAIGFTNGGMMVHRLAAERAHEFAAIAMPTRPWNPTAWGCCGPGRTASVQTVVHPFSARRL